MKKNLFVSVPSSESKLGKDPGPKSDAAIRMACKDIVIIISSASNQMQQPPESDEGSPNSLPLHSASSCVQVPPAWEGIVGCC